MKPLHAMFVHQFDLVETQEVCREYYDEYAQYMVENSIENINTELSQANIFVSVAHKLFTDKFLSKFAIPKNMLKEYQVSLESVLFFHDDFKLLLMQTCVIDHTQIYNAALPTGLSVKFKIYAEDENLYQTFLNNLKLKGVYIEELDGYFDVSDLIKKEINM